MDGLIPVVIRYGMSCLYVRIKHTITISFVSKFNEHIDELLFVYRTDKAVKRVFFNGNDKQLRYPNTTRWNSRYDAYVTIDKLQSHLIQVASQLPNTKEIQMNIQDWQMLADMINILTMFADITDELQ